MEDGKSEHCTSCHPCGASQLPKSAHGAGNCPTETVRIKGIQPLQPLNVSFSSLFLMLLKIQHELKAALLNYLYSSASLFPPRLTGCDDQGYAVAMCPVTHPQEWGQRGADAHLGFWQAWLKHNKQAEKSCQMGNLSFTRQY